MVVRLIAASFCLLFVTACLPIGEAGPLSSPTPRATLTAQPGGYRDFAYKNVSSPTASKPQSKVWFHDEYWWGVLFNSDHQEYRIYRLDWASQGWQDTEVAVDTRNSARIDVLWDGAYVYVVGAGSKRDNPNHALKLMRFSYDADDGRYRADDDFPVTITDGGMEAAVVAKDGLGRLWVTYTRDASVFVVHSSEGDDAWAAPYSLPVPEAANLNEDDVSSVVGFDGQIGVMWSNQTTRHLYFATHRDGAADSEWQAGIALAPPLFSDDHVNLTVIQGEGGSRVFAAVKTALHQPQDPLILLLERKVDGTWSMYTVSAVQNNSTRPIALVDRENQELYVFYSGPCCVGEKILYKRTSLNAIAFPVGVGTPFIESAADPCIGNPASTKQNVSRRSGLVVVASADCTSQYFHNSLELPPQS